MKHLRIRRNSFLKQFRNCCQGFADSQHDYAWTTEIFNQKEVQFFNRMTESGFIGQGRFDRYGPLRFGLDHLILDLNFEPEIQTKDMKIESRTEPLINHLGLTRKLRTKTSGSVVLGPKFWTRNPDHQLFPEFVLVHSSMIDYWNLNGIAEKLKFLILVFERKLLRLLQSKPDWFPPKRSKGQW